MTEKTRLDAALVERGLCTGRDRAKGIIMAGQVYVNNQKADKPGMTISSEDQIEVRGDQLYHFYAPLQPFAAAIQCVLGHPPQRT